MKPNPVLIVVHPGSACGSADFNIGIEAAVMRDMLADEIQQWEGDILIVDGDLSDELDTYARLGLAVTNAMDSSKHHGRTAVRVHACAMETPAWIDVAVSKLDETWPTATHAVVTGAWTQTDGNGCVDAVVQAIGHRMATTMSDAAMRQP